ncbi:MAG: YqzL family protein [Alicyclobacillus sp.]|nr:YqzL family protein [Alicyclobacillus sp.]
MRDFSWRYFTMTGDIDAYLLYKQHEELYPDWDDVPVEMEEQDAYPE